jgi:hypothetical protein
VPALPIFVCILTRDFTSLGIFQSNLCIHFSPLPCTHPFHYPWFNWNNNKRWRVQTMELFIT